ncbi:hypothetical protein QE152_g29395 [Popillia japonica]|uniref:Uncharacterized protein n=1 Tax=Popillia japonica TaxID=7064 RepID=A0AAW1JHX2_POPJA
MPASKITCRAAEIVRQRESGETYIEPLPATVVGHWFSMMLEGIDGKSKFDGSDLVGCIFVGAAKVEGYASAGSPWGARWWLVTIR